MTEYLRDGKPVAGNELQLINQILARQKQDVIDNKIQTEKFLKALSGTTSSSSKEAEYERRRRGQRLGVMMGMKQGLDFDNRPNRRTAETKAIAKFGALVHFVGQYVDVAGASEGDVVQTSIELSKALGQTPVVDIEKMKAEFSKLQSQRDVRIANKPTSGKKGFSAKYDKSTGIISGKMKTLKNTIDVHPVGSVLFDINLIIIQPIIVELTGILNDLLNQISNQKKINDDLTIEITKLAKILQ